jgi:hypothetical protein
MRRREKPDPSSFGVQPNGTYMPGPTEIKQRCAEIRKGWSAAERISRERWTQPLNRYRVERPNYD